MTEGMREFAAKHNYSFNDSRLERLYEYDLSARRDYESAMLAARIEGFAEGFAESIGEVEGRQVIVDETVRYALETNIPINAVQYTLRATPEQMDIALKKANYCKS